MPVDGRPPHPSPDAPVFAFFGKGMPWNASITRLAGDLRHRAAPNHWSFLFGAVSFACLAVLTVTGLFLMVFYTPSSTLVSFQGSYPLLRGVEMSEALASTLRITYDVRGGLLMRQAHHWAALLLPASLIVQLLSMFFTGAFRRPRQWSWVALFGIFALALAGGWSGYALPDDMLSGTGLRIVEGVVRGIPLVGTWASLLLFGGEFPGQILAHLYPLHVVVVPVGLAALVALRLRQAYVHGPAQFPGPGRTEQNVVGVPVLPTAATKAAGMFFLTIGILVLMAGTLTISPVAAYGPASPSGANAGSQPDWYTAFLDGALRLVPRGWEFAWLGRTWTLAVLVPLAAVTLFLALLAAYPFLEAWITGDRREHHLLDRPRNVPTRTGIGVAGMVFYGTLWAAASADLWVTQFGVSFEGVIGFLQAALVLGPVVAFVLTRRACEVLQEHDRELARHGVKTGQILRLPDGGYVEVHWPLDADRRSQVAAGGYPEPLALRPDSRGRVTRVQRLRVWLSHHYLDGAITPPPRAELEATEPTSSPFAAL